jgi:hypothetical protein
MHACLSLDNQSNELRYTTTEPNHAEPTQFTNKIMHYKNHVLHAAVCTIHVASCDGENADNTKQLHAYTCKIRIIDNGKQTLNQSFQKKAGNIVMP